jgi:hypothetical protein
VPIPAFEPSGFLPGGRHSATSAEMHAALVAAFAVSVRRPAIFDWWQRHLASMRWLTQVSRQWIGGSFVSAKDEPADIDVCTFLDGPTVDALPAEHQEIIRFMTSGQIAQAYWNCDSYPIVEYPPGHPNHAAFLAASTYWSNWWGQTRPDPSGAQQSRGYLEVV